MTEESACNEVTPAEYQQVDKLIKAVQYGDLKFVETAVEIYHMPVDLKDTDDCSLLHWAAINNRVQIIDFLLHHKANIHVIGGDNKEIPLQWAVRHAHCAQSVHLLISEGSNIHHKSAHGFDSLFLAVQACHVHIAFLLLNAGANVNTVDLNNDTPLYWLLRYRTEQNSLDMQRLLIRFRANVSHRGSNDRVALHYVVESGRTFDLHSAHLIYTTNYSTAVTDAKDVNGRTPLQAAWKSRNSQIIRFLADAYMFTHFPKWITIAITAASLFSFFLYLQRFNWFYGLILFGITQLISESVNQKYIVRANSRLSCGFAWGVIVSATWAYYRFVSRYMNIFWDVLIAFLTVAIVYSLLKSMYTSPQVLTGEEDETSRQTLVSKITDAQPILDINGRSIGITFKLCSTCLVDKSLASTHCNQCDHCAVSLDHHCPFVSNCVGKGNRRIFCIFTFFASTGCLLMALLSLYAQTYFICNDVYGILWGTIAVQICALQREKTLFCAAWLAAFTGLWILGVLVGQLGMVAAETTTFEIIKKGNHGVPMNFTNGLANIIKFISTGQYFVSEPSTRPLPKPCCSGHNTTGHSHTNVGIDTFSISGEETSRLLSGLEAGSASTGTEKNDVCNTSKLRSNVTDIMAKAQMFNSTQDD